MVVEEKRDERVATIVSMCSELMFLVSGYIFPKKPKKLQVAKKYYEFS